MATLADAARARGRRARHRRQQRRRLPAAPARGHHGRRLRCAVAHQPPRPVLCWRAPAPADAARRPDGAASSPSGAWPITSGFPENAAYAASKYGLRGLHETLLAEYRGTGVRLTLISPGPTDTGIWDPFDPEHRPGFPARAADAPSGRRRRRSAVRRHPSPARPHRLAPSGTGLTSTHPVPTVMLFRHAAIAALAGLVLAGGLARPRTRPPRCRRCPTAPAGGSTCSPSPATRGGAIWVGTYGQGIYRLPAGATAWESIRHDTTAGAISMDFVQAIAFGSRGQIWYGTVGNGWGLSVDGGHTWRNWTYDQLGPEWQYVIPDGIVIRGDTTVVATADGLQITTDDGAHWTAIGDAVGPPARGPADTALPLLANEYVRRLRHRPPRVERHHAPGQPAALARRRRGGGSSRIAAAAFPPGNAILIGRQQYPRHAVRAASDGRHAAVHPKQRARGRRAPGAAHRLAPAAHRADRQSLHRPDLSLRLDDGRVSSSSTRASSSTIRMARP